MLISDLKGKRFSPTGIEYLQASWGIMSGCENKQRGICPIPDCWAEGMTKRFKYIYPNGFIPTLYPDALLSPLEHKKPLRIGVAFMSDIAGEWVNPEQIVNDKSGYADCTLKFIVLDIIKRCPQHSFYFLTKNPVGYSKWFVNQVTH
jgi:protein gp37